MGSSASSPLLHSHSLGHLAAAIAATLLLLKHSKNPPASEFLHLLPLPCLLTEVGHSGGGALVAKSCLTLVTSWVVARQAPLSMGYSRQEYWSGLPFSSPGT